MNWSMSYGTFRFLAWFVYASIIFRLATLKHRFNKQE